MKPTHLTSKGKKVAYLKINFAVGKTEIVISIMYLIKFEDKTEKDINKTEVKKNLKTLLFLSGRDAIINADVTDSEQYEIDEINALEEQATKIGEKLFPEFFK